MILLKDLAFTTFKTPCPWLENIVENAEIRRHPCTYKMMLSSETKGLSFTSLYF